MLLNNKSDFKPLYSLNLSIKEKNPRKKKVCKEIYRADGVNFSAKAKRNLKMIEALGFTNVPVCIAKDPAFI